MFSHKTPSEIVFSKFKRQIWMFFHVWISQLSNLFFCIDKICFYINKICSLHIMFNVYLNLLTVFIKYFFALSKIVHYFLHKLFLAFCIKLFSVQHYLKNCLLSFLCKLFFVHYLKNCSLFSHKTPSEIVFSKFKHQI